MIKQNIMTDKPYNPNEKKTRQLMAKKIVYDHKDDLEFLQYLQKFVVKRIEKHKFTIMENKLKEIIPSDVKIIKVDTYDNIEDSRTTDIIELKIDNNIVKIYKQISISQSSNNILEEFYIAVNSKKIFTLYDENAYKINTQIEDKTLKIKECVFISNETIFKLLHFFTLY